MSDSRWNSVAIVTLSGDVEALRTAYLPDVLDAVVLDCPEPTAGLAVVAGRTTCPIVVLADVGPEGSAVLVERGAEEVLPRRAGFAEATAAARHAVARRRRTAPVGRVVPAVADAPAEQGAAGPAPPTPPASPAPADETRAERRAMPASGPRSAPRDMPPQLQAVGRLAGGIAHDFNNLLQVISGNAESLLHELEPDDAHHANARAIVDATRRAAMLTHQLLAFGRRQTLIATPLDLSALVTEALNHVRSRVGPRVTVTTQLAQGIPQVHADRSQLLEVLSNLADNAAEAMPEAGTLLLSTDVVDVDDDMRRVRPWLKPGRYVRLLVSDTGPGIEEQALPHLFEPFFSTKPQWGGTGLGLSSVYGIVKQSDGFIWVESDVGRGTCITILLPALTGAAPQPVPAGHRGAIVLVEDDEGVRDLLEGVLAHYGFTVTAYGSAEQALGHAEPFDLLLSDVLLPGMNGPELARALKARFPSVPVLLMSGDTGHVVDPKDIDARGFLQKPFSASTLVARVEELIASARLSGR